MRKLSHGLSLHVAPGQSLGYEAGKPMPDADALSFGSQVCSMSDRQTYLSFRWRWGRVRKRHLRATAGLLPRSAEFKSFS